MIICGLKLTHDGCLSLIEDNRLIFSYEAEKFNNNRRYSKIENLEFIAEALSMNGYRLSNVDRFVVDGWAGLHQSEVSVKNGNELLFLKVAPYREKSLSSDSLETFYGSGLRVCGQEFAYTSYLHSTTHILSAYCSSPFSARQEPAYILVYDGGMYPRLYYFEPQNELVNLGPIFLFIGNIYSLFSLHFEPFRKQEEAPSVDDLSVAGKVMAYIAKGKINDKLINFFDHNYKNNFLPTMEFNWRFSQEARKYADVHDIPHEDILASFHYYMQELIISSLKRTLQGKQKTRNFCFVGGCSLNIKWNSAIRASGLFDDVFVSPFTNDTGSAIGAACCEMFKATRNPALHWSVYSGPPIIKNGPADDSWLQRDCTLKDLARILHETNEPVVFLLGKAELGPRALGNRSILAAAVRPEMKDRLNRIKKREDYRPVSPICMEERAPMIFSPGTKDPYMLFDHKVLDDWVDRIPAVCHLDGTSRLQTVSKKENLELYTLLEEYERLCGIPVLCNTSANYLGAGFFPDVFSATKWNGTEFVWCEETLYYKQTWNKVVTGSANYD